MSDPILTPGDEPVCEGCIHQRRETVRPKMFAHHMLAEYLCRPDTEPPIYCNLNAPGISACYHPDGITYHCEEYHRRFTR